MLSVEDLLVVSIEQAVAAPLCSMRLADAGARVIKIEPKGGETARRYDQDVAGESAYFTALNRGKESLELNLRDIDDFEFLKRILSKADVFIRNTAPGTMDRIGLGWKELQKHFERLIILDIFGYGQDTEYKDMKAYDLLIQAESGLCSVTGTKEQAVKVGVSIADLGTGMNAYSAVLEALIEREKTGQGAHIELAMFDTVAEWMSVPLLHFEYANKLSERHGMAHSSIYPYRPYSCSDGEILVAVQSDEQWSKFCHYVLQQDTLATDERFSTNTARVSNRNALDKLISDVTRMLTTLEFQLRLEDAGTAFGRVSNLGDLSTHPALRRQPVVIDHQVVQAVASPLCSSRKTVKKIPSLGEQNQSIRQEFE